ncbi:MAG: hypothetical protein RXS42_07140 [Nitrososphaeria archaeon]
MRAFEPAMESRRRHLQRRYPGSRALRKCWRRELRRATGGEVGGPYSHHYPGSFIWLLFSSTCPGSTSAIRS